MPALSKGERDFMSAAMIAFAIPFLMSCSQEPAKQVNAEAPAANDDLQRTTANLNLAMSQRNFGTAADQAKAAQARFPNEPEIHMIAAKAEAQLGNAGNAAAAFQRAIETGLQEPSDALSNAMFDSVRQSDSFAQLRAELAPARVRSSLPPPASAGRDHIRAGDVEIMTDERGDYIRAGDVVLDTRP